MTEIFKVKTGIAPELMKGVFEFIGVTYILRNQSECNRSIPCIERYGIEWHLHIPIVQNYGTNCPCKICKLFIRHVGYL